MSYYKSKHAAVYMLSSIGEIHQNAWQSDGRSDKGRSDKGKPRGSSIVSARMVKRVKREICRNPFQMSKEIF